MKKWIGLFTCFVLVVGLAACSGLPGASDHSFFNSQTSWFNSMEVMGGDVITAHFTAYLNETEAAFLTIKASEDAEATLRYTYSTENQDGVTLGYYTEETTDRTTISLKAAAKEAFDAVWTEETVSLKKGTNVFYLAGDDLTCKMSCEITGLDPSVASLVSD